ncbi:MAG TPA: sugar phosphate isomerase/epimerase [Bryobacteraceae bacterium]|nr:sugar phosphate isomerase/epimerase [Bryobacteraceae bacterium]
MPTPPVSRRSVIATSLAAPLLAADFYPKVLGAQLYTVRDILPKDPAAVIKGIAAIGYKEVEGSPELLTQYAQLLTDNGLTMPCAMVNLPALAAEKVDATISEAHKLGLKNLGLSYLNEKERADIPAALNAMNRAAELAHKAGMRFYYHNHCFEFAGAPGQRVFDRIVKECSPNVMLECDVFWLTIGGQDPAAVITQLGNRVLSLHLKDVAKGTAVYYKESDVPRTAFKEVGNGTVDFKTVLAAAKKASVQHFFVEQDQTPGDPLASIRQSYEYLRSLS